MITPPESVRGRRGASSAPRAFVGSRSRIAALCVLVSLAALVLVATSLGAATAPGARTAAKPPKITLPTKPMSAEDAEPIIELAEELAGYPDQMPGLLVGVWDPVKGVYRGGFGKAELPDGPAPTARDSFRVGSVTKTFTATLVLQLVAEKKLSLDGRVAQYAPKLAKRHPEIARLTLRQLLSMRSGLPEYTDEMVRNAPSRGWTHKVWSPGQLIDFAFKTGKAGPPDPVNAIYINTNYIILGQVLTAVTGKTPRELVQTRLLRPLGLARTRYPRLADATIPSPSTHGYVTADGLKDFLPGSIQANTDASDWSPSWGGSAGIMTSTLDDLARWAAARFGSALLPAKPRAERTRTAAPIPSFGVSSARYGLGLQIIGQWEGHFGGIPGWTTMVLRNTKTGVILVASINACCGAQTNSLTYFPRFLYPGTWE